MNFQIKFPYSLLYKGAYGKQERKKLLFYMAVHFTTLTSITGNYYAFN